MMQHLWIQGLFIGTLIISIYSLPDDALSERCNAPPADAGMCRALFRRWTFSDGCCIEFGYGGCDGNDNNFHTFEECAAACSGGSKCNGMAYLGNQTAVPEALVVELPFFEKVPQSSCLIEEHPEGRIYGGVTVNVFGNILTCGGQITGVYDTGLSTCYLLRKGKWYEKPSLNSKRRYAAAAVADTGMVVITGGVDPDDHDSPLSSTEILKPGLDWIYGPQLPHPMYYHCMTKSSVGFIVAGYAGGTFAIYKLDLDENKWMTLLTRDDWNIRSYQSCMMLDEDTLAIIGGSDERISRRVDLLNLKLITWRAMPDLPVKFSHQTAFLYANSIYVIKTWPDGDVYKLPIGSLENSWSKVTSLGYIKRTAVFGAQLSTKDMLCNLEEKNTLS